MSEPKRLRDEGPEEVRALFRAARPTRGMTAEERARSRERVGRYVAAATLAAALSWVPGAALGAGLGVLAVGVIHVVPALLSPAPPAREPVSAPLVTASARVAAPPSAAPAEPAPPPPPAPSTERPAPRASVAAPPAASSSAEPVNANVNVEANVDALAEEVALLDRARAALASNPAEALSLAGEHAARFPRGKMGMEREIVAIDALRRLGRAEEARARGEALLARARGSLYEQRVQQLIEGAR